MSDDYYYKRLRLGIPDFSLAQKLGGYPDNLNGYFDNPTIKSINDSILANQRSIEKIIAPSLHDSQHHAMLGLSIIDATSRSLGSYLKPSASQEAVERFNRDYLQRHSATLAAAGAYSDMDLKRFALPASADLAAQLYGLGPDRLLPATRFLGFEHERTLQAAAAIRSPWLEVENTAGSIARFTELQSIGRAVRLNEAFEDMVTNALRGSLGDWRDPINFDYHRLSHLKARTELYIQHGFNADLTDFPEVAFDEGLDTAELRNDPPPLIQIYESPVPSMEDGALEEGLVRNSTAYNWIVSFETQIRHFIDTRMAVAFGPDWPRHRLPNNMLDRWIDKKNKDTNNERHQRIIVYADFTDYELIVNKKDNFRDVFSPFFIRPENFRESMQRLCLPRIEVMHARIITQDDALFLYAELRRLTNQFIKNN